MSEKLNLFICMGSACHQSGVYHVLPIVQQLLQQYHLQDQVELKGAFCMDNCTHGITMRFGEQLFSDLDATNITRQFEQKILPAILAWQKENTQCPTG